MRSQRPIEAHTLQLSDSEKLNAANARDTEDSPPQSHAYEELVEVVTRAVEKLFSESSSSIKYPILPTKLVRITSALVGKAYSAAGQAAACLHTMSLLQAYQAELLTDLDEGEGISPNTVCELRRATDLSLREPSRRRLNQSAGLWQPWWPLRDIYGWT